MRLLSLALLVMPLPALGETYTALSAPTAVTIYPGFAMVTRELRVEVGTGAHEIVLPDLPRWIDADSLRVSLQGADLGTTVLRTDALPPQPTRDSAAVAEAKARIDAAERALQTLDDAVEDATLAVAAAQARLAFLQGLARSETLPSDVQSLANMAEMIEAQTLAARQVQLGAERAARDLRDGRDTLEQDLADARAALAALTPPADTAALLSLSVTAAQAGTVVARVSYPAQAFWQPTYDVILDRDGGDRVSLRRAALITQNSGENWEDVRLTLSTLSPSGQVLPSELYPPLLRFEDRQEQADMQRSMSSLSADAVGAPEPVPQAAPRPKANFDGPGVTYTLPAPLSVAQGAEAARIEMDTLAFDARVYARAVPARDATAYLMAQATNSSAEPLLAAPRAQIFVDGALVGRAPFSAVAAGEAFTQSFGPVEELQLKYTVQDRSEGDRGLINRSNAQTQSTMMTVQNIGDENWEVEVLDAVPYTEQDDLVIQWEARPPADATNVEGRRGLVQWDLTVGAMATQTITVDRIVRWPEGKVLR